MRRKVYRSGRTRFAFEAVHVGLDVSSIDFEFGLLGKCNVLYAVVRRGAKEHDSQVRARATLREEGLIRLLDDYLYRVPVMCHLCLEVSSVVPPVYTPVGPTVKNANFANEVLNRVKGTLCEFQTWVS